MNIMNKKAKMSLPPGILHAYRVWCYNETTTAARSTALRQSIRCPLPVSVFNWRLTDGCIGFLSWADRNTGRIEMTAMFEAAGWYVHATNYIDKRSDYALQISVCIPNDVEYHEKDGKEVAVSWHHYRTSGRVRQRLVSLRNRKTLGNW